MVSNKKHQIAHPALVLIGIFLIASNLRSPITGIGPILEFISLQIGLSATQAGMLTTLPLLAFAIFSPLSSGLARKVGLEPSLMIALIVLAGGVVIRSSGSTVALFVGTCVIGVGIAIGNVLLPSLLKRDFPNIVPTLTAIYVLVMGIGSSISSSAAVPMLHLADRLNITAIPNWAFSLASVSLLLTVAAIIMWLPQLNRHTRPTADTADVDSHSYLWRSAAAWQVTIFFGVNSFVMYIFIAWLPSILIDNGYTEHQAGYIHGILQLSTAVPALVLIPLMARVKDKRILGLMMALLSFVGIVGLLMAPQHATIWVITFGFSSGGGFILALSFVGLRTHNAQQTAALSGMVQCMGYLLAATGPIIFGSLHEVTGGWEVPLMITAAICIVWAIFALFAGKSHVISEMDTFTKDAEIKHLKSELERVKEELKHIKNSD